MNDKLAQLWKDAEATGEEIDIGNIVVCDFCSEDFTMSDEVGGVLFGSYGVCPRCVHKIAETGEESLIRDRANPGETFRDFTLRMRGGNNTIRISRKG